MVFCAMNSVIKLYRFTLQNGSTINLIGFIITQLAILTRLKSTSIIIGIAAFVALLILICQILNWGMESKKIFFKQNYVNLTYFIGLSTLWILSHLNSIK